MNIKFLLQASILLLIPILLPPQTYASTITNTFAVSATILGTCSTVAPTAMAFGTYASGSASNTTNSIVVTCIPLTTYTVALDKGTTSGGSIAQRLMTNGSGTLNYNIFTTSGYTTVWGDGTGSSVTMPGTGTTTFTAYGQVPSGQTSASVGSYSDSITVTVTY